MINLSTATSSHEHYIKITALQKFRRHLGTLGMKATAVSSARMVTFPRNYRASHFKITDTPETWLYTNRNHINNRCTVSTTVSPIKAKTEVHQGSFLPYIPPTLRSPLFWDITQGTMVGSYGRCGTPYRSHLQGSRLFVSWRLGWWVVPKRR